MNGGVVKTHHPNGKQLVSVGTSERGGSVYVYNKSGEGIAQIAADDYGNGEVGAWNRKGMGRELKLGPRRDAYSFAVATTYRRVSNP